MFDFLKKLFQTEKEKLVVKEEELNKWFEETTKDYEKEQQEYEKQKISEINELKKEIEEAVHELDKARHEDEDKVMPKIKNIVTGARQNYIRQISFLIKEVSIDNKTTESLINSCQESQQKINTFAIGSVKSYYATQHLFHKQVEHLADLVKTLDKLVKELGQTTKTSKHYKTEQIKKLMQEIRDDTSLLHKFQETIKQLEERKKNQQNQAAETEKQTQELNNTEQHKQYEQDIEKLVELKKQHKQVTDEIFETLAPLDAAIKKYERITMENQDVLKKYAENPTSALIEDKSLQILQVLQNMKLAIETGSVELKDSKKQKTLKTIETINKEQLEQLQKQEEEIRQQTENLRQQISQNQIEKQTQELIKKKQKIQEELQETEREIKETNHKLKKINLEKQKQEIITQISEMLEKEVIIE